MQSELHTSHESDMRRVGDALVTPDPRIHEDPCIFGGGLDCRESLHGRADVRGHDHSGHIPPRRVGCHFTHNINHLEDLCMTLIMSLDLIPDPSVGEIPKALRQGSSEDHGDSEDRHEQCEDEHFGSLFVTGSFIATLCL